MLVLAATNNSKSSNQQQRNTAWAGHARCEMSLASAARWVGLGNGEEREGSDLIRNPCLAGNKG